MSKNKKFPSDIRSADSFVYDLLVIGGGITGAHVLWDSTLRGMKSILLEKNDYASGTSQATSKMIHGGLRYLKNFELGLVRESLRERATFARITPQAIQTMGFVVPIYSNIERFVLKTGMEMYNALSYDRNSDISKDRLIPKYSFLSKEQTVMESPTIKRDQLKGSYLYYDYLNINPERHTCELFFPRGKEGPRQKIIPKWLLLPVVRIPYIRWSQKTKFPEKKFRFKPNPS